MKFTRMALATLFLIILSTNAHTQERRSQVKLYVSTNEISNSNMLGLLQIDHFSTDENGAIIVEVRESDLERLDAIRYKYEILIPDVVKHLDSLNRLYYASLKKKKNSNFLGKVAIEQSGKTIDNIIATPAAFEVKQTFGGYYSFSEMETAMNTLVQAYPEIVQKSSIGKTSENRDIWVIKISDGVTFDEINEPEVLFIGLQHAREAITGASMIFFMQYLCEQYKINPQIKDLVDNREIYIIPCFNPDGWEYNRTYMGGKPGGDWRKNRSRNIAGYDRKGNPTGYTYGVDLNRNWGVDWGNCPGSLSDQYNSCGTTVTSADTYIGPSAFSELETKALSNFTKSHHIVVGFDQHAYGPYYSLPFGRKGLHIMPQKGKDFYTAIPALMGKYNGMRAADSYDALGYEVAGGFKDWMLMGDIGSTIGTGKKDTVWAMTGEGSAGGGTPAFGNIANFWAPAAQITNLCKGMTFQNLQLAYAAGTYVDIQDASDISVTAKSGSFKFRVKRLGLGNEQVKVTLVPLENILTGESVILPKLSYYENYDGIINYNLPVDIRNGQPIKFSWKVEMGGYTYSETVTKVYNPTELIYDDMEGDIKANWMFSGNWAFSELDKYSGLKSLTESPGGNYLNNSNLIVAHKSVINLSDANAAYLTFWVKHRAENFRDKMQVEISSNSTDGINGTWKAVTGRTTIQEPGTLDGSTLNGQPSLTGILDYWTQEVFDLSSFKGNAEVRFRFNFTSNAGGSKFKYEVDDGFYIDNLKIIKTAELLVPLPVNFLDFYGSLVADNTVQLIWEANVDDQHHYFEVERSNDGNQFTVLGKLPQMSAFRFADKSPRSGNNFYRIKQVDKDGTVSYSKIINVYIESTIKVSIYPNPVNDQLVINIGSRNAQNYKIQVTDMQGKVVYGVLKNINSSNTEIKVDTRSWKPQLYILKVINTNNEVVETQKIIKL